jgi:multidrug transporter EmrE-like cation transporter
MKKADGMTHKWYLMTGGVCYAATFFLLAMALKYLPMGYTNAVWAGTSTFLVYMAGMIWFKDKTSFREISMGMSSDYKIAVEEGSTMVRIGSLLFQ